MPRIAIDAGRPRTTPGRHFARAMANLHDHRGLPRSGSAGLVFCAWVGRLVVLFCLLSDVALAQGVVTEYRSGEVTGPNAITAGPDGNLWFTEDYGHRIGRITQDGVITEFSTGIPSGVIRVLGQIASDPDGRRVVHGAQRQDWTHQPGWRRYRVQRRRLRSPDADYMPPGRDGGCVLPEVDGETSIERVR